MYMKYSTTFKECKALSNILLPNIPNLPWSHGYSAMKSLQYRTMEWPANLLFRKSRFLTYYLKLLSSLEKVTGFLWILYFMLDTS